MVKLLKNAIIENFMIKNMHENLELIVKEKKKLEVFLVSLRAEQGHLPSSLLLNIY